MPAQRTPSKSPRPAFKKDRPSPNKGRDFDKQPRPFKKVDSTHSPRTSRPDDRKTPVKPRSVWDDPLDMSSESYESSDQRRERRVPAGADRLDEIKACGVNACRAIFKSRPQDLVRAYVTEEMIKEFGDVLKFCSSHKKAYHVVRSDELNKISGSTHHEGVCVIAKAKADQTWDTLLKGLQDSKTKPRLVLVLEDVGNPHNVGAILRTAAHFGVDGILAVGKESFKPSPALLRTAEGGYETVGITAAPALSAIVSELKNLKFEIVATAADSKKTIFEEEAIAPRVAFIIGNESRGLSPNARKLADVNLAIPGTGAVESLNVSAATASICSEFWRAYRT